MGGSIRKLVRSQPDAAFVWVTLSSDAQRAVETRAAAARLLAGAKEASVRVERFRPSYFPYDGGAIKDYFETLKQSVRPDLIFTHYQRDLHQDHRVANELTWNTFRDHLILEYEIPKYDGDMGSPNVFVPLTADELNAKIDLLLECFPSQKSHAWFTRSTFEAIARLRGIECNAPDGFAEAFYVRKATLTI